MGQPYTHYYWDANGEQVYEIYESWSEFLAFNYKFPSPALDQVRHSGVVSRNGDILTKAPSRNDYVITFGTDESLDENTLMKYLESEDLVQYLSFDSVELMEETVEKFVEWSGKAPILWTGINAVANWWFKIGVASYQGFVSLS